MLYAKMVQYHDKGKILYKGEYHTDDIHSNTIKVNATY